MNQWATRVACRRILCVGLLCLASCGGGGHGPTAPGSPLPQIAGDWSGSFGISGFFAFRATMKLVQADDGTIQGLLFIFPNYIDIAGRVSSTSFTFHSVGGCLAVTGSLDLTMKVGTPTQMSGTTSQDFGPCFGAPGGHPQVGFLDLLK